jgi:hypothetical protein
MMKKEVAKKRREETRRDLDSISPSLVTWYAT